MPRPIDVQHPRRECYDVTPVADNRGILIQNIPQLFHQPHRMDGRLLAVQHRLIRRLQRPILGHHLLHPSLARRPVPRRLQPVHNLPQHRLGIAHDARVNIAVLPDLAGVHHYLHQLRVLREHIVRAVAQPEVYRRPDEYHRVRLHQPIAPPKAAQIRMIRGNAPAPHRVQKHRRVYHLNKLAQLIRGVVPPYIRTRQHHRPLRVSQNVHYLLNILRIAIRPRVSAVARGIAHSLFVRTAPHDVYRYLQIHRPRHPRSRMPKRDRHILRYALHPLDLLRELSHRLQESRAIEILQPAPQMVADARVAADHHHRAWRLECVGDARNRVGNARPRRNDSHARLARNLRPALRRVRRNLLVPEINHLDPLIHAALIEIVDMPAIQREHILHALPLQRLSEQSPAVYLCHFASP